MVVDVSSQIIVPLAMGKYLDPSREHRSQSSAHPTGGLGSTHTLNNLTPRISMGGTKSTNSDGAVQRSCLGGGGLPGYS